MVDIFKNQQYAPPKTVTKLRKKQTPAMSPKQAQVAGQSESGEDNLDMEEYQALDRTVEGANDIDPVTNLPYRWVPGVEEAVGPDDLLMASAPVAKAASKAVVRKLASREAPQVAKTAAREIAEEAPVNYEKMTSRELGIDSDIFPNATNEEMRQAIKNIESAPKGPQDMTQRVRQLQSKFGRKLTPEEIEMEQVFFDKYGPKGFED